MRIYEELFILRPDAVEEEIDAYLEQIKTLITSSKGTVDKVEKWGVRKLAYRVEKRNEGFYILVQFSTESPALVKEVERRMRVTDSVMKWITVRIDEALKKLDKRKLQREKRAKRKPQITVAPAAPAIPVAPALPAEPASAAPGQPVVHAAPAPAAPAPAAPAVEAPAAPAAEAPVEAAAPPAAE
ncbi:MAG: 30S ribosomal protein S6 [Bryobacteraceae bacterium]|nr:30S ribosomal protein S6 [Bryobacteraceae bacterium]